ncbi:MAG: thioredoxin family protein, partial [Mariniphaga sp.]
MKQLFFNLLGFALITLFVSAQIPGSTGGFFNPTDNNFISSAPKNIPIEKIDERQIELFPEDEKSKTGITFHQGNWKEALETAKKENKPIFLDISASWCAPCKLLKANTFT